MVVVDPIFAEEALRNRSDFYRRFEGGDPVFLDKLVVLELLVFERLYRENLNSRRDDDTHINAV